ncbi:MAG: RNA-directed DNA polymerase [Fusobacterium perfoetens]|uniref:RNA-directed DNA polymerase n=1 Tax=Fusobacterium perfoetens TaxID=852 RepID=UPI0023EFAA51|nr:RNA-directed DNA polymerase [Fusobacterium perfoetens]MCI6151974.1 RNA-directed DNA polymerase [Fusobacterium perfoetens]MDY3237887.1 RNA-directed DNA polymerase [Fusobacterium perfoetens]
MGKTSNIERNKLDYILTDVLPVELSELFSLDEFYNFLLKNYKTLNEIIKELKNAPEERKIFKHGWNTLPLKYNISKNSYSFREISLLSPLAILNIYLFLEYYQKELLILLKEKKFFSLRYHKKNTDLYYKKRNKKTYHYFYKYSKELDRNIIQQTGIYYKIGPFNSLASFTSSNLWQECNFKYKNFAKIDYKSCFKSIYSHSYKWIIENSVADSKDSENKNIYLIIDRVLQNINGASTNGIVVGPEFSRMIAELMLQQIDYEVKIRLSQENKEENKDYNVFRYVDDIFIFANTSIEIDNIINIYSNVAQKYLLNLNELKLFKTTTPVFLNKWIIQTRNLADKISDIFYKPFELREKEEKYLLKDNYISIEKLKTEFLDLIINFKEEQRYIVSFLLSTLLNNISHKKEGYNIFKEKISKGYVLLDLAFYIFSFSACFEHSQKMISIISYLSEEMNFLENNDRLEKLIRRYSFIFENGNQNDLCNWFLLFSEYKISLFSKNELQIENTLENEDNPILWANYLIYSRYNKEYYEKIKKIIEDKIEIKLKKINKNECFLEKEIWYIFIFKNCPYLDIKIKNIMETFIKNIISKGKNPSQKIIKIIWEFLLLKKKNLFFHWDLKGRKISKQITYRTYERTLFKNYKKRSTILFSSLD